MNAPISKGTAIDISTTDHTLTGRPTRGIGVAAAGAVVWVGSDGTNVTSYLIAGVIHEIATNKIIKVGTTATGIVAYF